MDSVDHEAIKSHGSSKCRCHGRMSKRIDLNEVDCADLVSVRAFCTGMRGWLTYLPSKSWANPKVFEQIVVSLSHLVDQDVKICVGFIRLHPPALREAPASNTHRVKQKKNDRERGRRGRGTFHEFEPSLPDVVPNGLPRFLALGIEPPAEIRTVGTHDMSHSHQTHSLTLHVHLGPHKLAAWAS